MEVQGDAHGPYGPAGGSETNFEFDFYENLATEAIATLAHLSRAVAKLETQAVEARSPARESTKL